MTCNTDRLGFYAAKLFSDGKHHSFFELVDLRLVEFDTEFDFSRPKIMRAMHHYLEPGKKIIGDYGGFRIVDVPRTERMNMKEVKEAIMDVLKDGEWHNIEDVKRIIIGNSHESHCGSKASTKVFFAYADLKSNGKIIEFDDYVEDHPVWMVRLNREGRP